MTKKEARELAKVMIAYADGKDIEHRLYGTNKWATFNGNDKDHHLSFNFSKYAYRIKKCQLIDHLRIKKNVGMKFKNILLLDG